jgi:hypothetical protein
MSPKHLDTANMPKELDIIQDFSPAVQRSSKKWRKRQKRVRPEISFGEEDYKCGDEWLLNVLNGGGLRAGNVDCLTLIIYSRWQILEFLTGVTLRMKRHNSL